MCSQPPRDIDDSHLVEEILEMIPLISTETPEIGITGGEPTLLGERFIEVLQSLKTQLPHTAVHVLTNGRSFENPKFAEAVAAVGHPDIMLGIPLYADVAWKHDFIVQAEGAFAQTVRGLFNLGSVGIPLEIRFVIHAQSYDRLPQTMRYIGRNFPFVHHVALMGLEMTGFTRTNLEALWIEPMDYSKNLIAAVSELSQWGIEPRIYNHQLCLLHENLWPIARKSISDWKNIYYPECEPCAVKDKCGGFFASSSFKRSSQIAAVSH